MNARRGHRDPASGFREQARRPLLLVLLVALPFVFITRAIAQDGGRRRGSSACPAAARC